MTHGDDDGLILPPKVAPHQVSLVPIMRDEAGRGAIAGHCQEIGARLKAAGIRVHLDSTDARSADKIWASIKRGVPIRVEIGEREMQSGQVTMTRRDLGKAFQRAVSAHGLPGTIRMELDAMQAALLARSQAFMIGNIHDTGSISAVRDFFAAGQPGFARAPASVLQDPEMAGVRKEFAVTPRCLPFVDQGQSVILGRSY